MIRSHFITLFIILFGSVVASPEGDLFWEALLTNDYKEVEYFVQQEYHKEAEFRYFPQLPAVYSPGKKGRNTPEFPDFPAFLTTYNYSPTFYSLWMGLDPNISILLIENGGVTRPCSIKKETLHDFSIPETPWKFTSPPSVFDAFLQSERNTLSVLESLIPFLAKEKSKVLEKDKVWVHPRQETELLLRKDRIELFSLLFKNQILDKNRIFSLIVRKYPKDQKMMQLCLDHGVYIDTLFQCQVPAYVRWKEGKDKCKPKATALHHAIHMGDYDLALFLVAHGAATQEAVGYAKDLYYNYKHKKPLHNVSKPTQFYSASKKELKERKRIRNLLRDHGS